MLQDAYESGLKHDAFFLATLPQETTCRVYSAPQCAKVRVNVKRAESYVKLPNFEVKQTLPLHQFLHEAVES